MMTNSLVKLIETQLSETSVMSECVADFVRKIVDLHILQISNKGHIPLDFMEDVITEIETEVIEIYRKKTYGFLSLEEYRRHKFRQPDDN
jgi:hypothetical protein